MNVPPPIKVPPTLSYLKGEVTFKKLTPLPILAASLYSQEVDEVETEEQAQDRVAELRDETGNNAYYEEVKDKEEPLKESGTLWTSETTEDDYDKEELKANQYQDYLDNFDSFKCFCCRNIKSMFGKKRSE